MSQQRRAWACLIRVWLLALLNLALASSDGWAGQGDPGPVRLEVREIAGLPFSRADLEEAVETRVSLAAPSSAARITVTITGTRPGRVGIVSATRWQEVSVGGRPTTDAVRLVALAVLDVLRAPPPVGASPPMSLVAPAQAARGGFGMALLPGASVGLRSWSPLFEPVLDVGWRATGRPGAGVLGVGMQVGFGQASASWTDRRFTLTTLPLRLGPRWRYRSVDATAGAAMRLFRTGGLEGGSGAIAGGFIALRGSIPLGRGLNAVVAVACDVYAERVDFRADGRSLIKTGSAVPWLGLGLSWETPS